jgi:hypothetical protein
MIMTATQHEVLEQILALRRVTHETGTQTRRSQNHILQSLADADLIAIAAELARHQEAHGW